MLRVPIDQAQPGMVLARSVANPQKLEHILLKAGFELDEEHIKKLKKLRVFSLWVKYPGLDFLDDLLDPQLIQQQQELYKSLKDNFTEVQDQGLDQIDYNQYTIQMGKLFRQLLDQKNPSALLATELQGASEDIYLHGTTVASMALLIGLRLEHYLIRSRPNLAPNIASDLTQLGVGCLLHDIGKLQLPEETRNFHITAQNLGDEQWQKHTEAGFDMIKGGMDPLAGQVVLNHHQHYDGSGFPVRKSLPGSDEPVLPLSGEDIHIFCRIASLADRFEGFRHLPDGCIAPTIVVLKRLKNPGYAKWFDPVVYEGFTTALPPFSPGEQVTLSDGRDVVVIEINNDNPCRPIVRPIDTKKAQDPDKKEEVDDSQDINLTNFQDLHIARVGNFDVTAYLH